MAPKSALETGGPGQYDAGKSMGKDIKSFTFSQTKSHKRIETSAGPGHYDIDRATSATKSRVPTATFSKTKARPGTFASAEHIDSAGPGQYDDGKRFNSNVKSFRIGEKRPEKVKKSMGPGEYSPERADAMTKSKTPNITMGGSPSRPKSFARGGDINVAPGQYDDGQRFNSNVKGFKIAEKREAKTVETMGPGAYDPDLADR